MFINFNMDQVRKLWRSRAKRTLVHMLLKDRHGVPVAFVNHGHVTWVHQEGSQDIGAIFVNHPDHRFAIVRERDSFCVYDMDTARIDNSVDRVQIDDPEIYPTEEAAVMSAMLRA